MTLYPKISHDGDQVVAAIVRLAFHLRQPPPHDGMREGIRWVREVMPNVAEANRLADWLEQQLPDNQSSEHQS